MLELTGYKTTDKARKKKIAEIRSYNHMPNERAWNLHGSRDLMNVLELKYTFG